MMTVRRTIPDLLVVLGMCGMFMGFTDIALTAGTALDLLFRIMEKNITAIRTLDKVPGLIVQVFLPIKIINDPMREDKE